MSSKHYLAAIRWAGAALALAGIVVVYRRWFHVNATTVALTMLLLILVLAANWGLRYAAACSVAAAVCYNFFFLPPIGTFTISDPQNWLALFAFLATAVTGSRLAERAREEATDARARQRELEVLYLLSRTLLQTENVSALLNTLAPAVRRATSAAFVSIYLLDQPGPDQSDPSHPNPGEGRLYQSGDLANPGVQLDTESLKQLALSLPTIDLSGSDYARVPLRTGVRPRGLLTLRGVHLSPETLEAIAGLVSISLDRAQALEDLTRGEASKESERLRNLMIDSITHELRTPITAIRSSASALLASSTLTPHDRHDLLAIEQESGRLNRLVTEAVEMTQLDAQEVHMTFAPASVDELLHHALESCASPLEGRSVEVKLPAHQALPQVSVDREYIQKVLCNLLENAAKYSPPGTPIVLSANPYPDPGPGSNSAPPSDIQSSQQPNHQPSQRPDRWGAPPQPDRVAIHVADRGQGIESAEQSLIFDRFYRARGQGFQTSGTGMGLAICRAIVEAHRGALSVTSQPGQGSVFTFTLPTAHPRPTR